VAVETSQRKAMVPLITQAAVKENNERETRPGEVIASKVRRL
jgi:hypothetical protein